MARSEYYLCMYVTTSWIIILLKVFVCLCFFDGFRAFCLEVMHFFRAWPDSMPIPILNFGDKWSYSELGLQLLSEIQNRETRMQRISDKHWSRTKVTSLAQKMNKDENLWIGTWEMDVLLLLHAHKLKKWNFAREKCKKWGGLSAEWNYWDFCRRRWREKVALEQ